MHTRTLALAAGLLTSAAALAQDAKPIEKAPQKPADAAQPEPPKEAKPGPAQPPSLDDLLGLPADKRPATSPKPDAPKPAQPKDANQEALERMLTQEEMAEQFAQAARLMAQTADRLEQSRDTSIQTQRIQDDIIRKLDQIIADAKKQQKQSKSKSSSSKSQQGDQPQDQPQQGSQGQQQGEERANSAAQQAGQAPTGNDAKLNPEVARGATWGNLPARYRDALLQGNSDTFSLMYKSWTEAYYKRLAEEAGK